MSKIININDVYSSSAVMGSWADWAKIVDIIYEKYNVDINTCSGASVGGWSSSGASVGGWVCPTKTIWDRISNEIEESTISIKGNYLDNQLVKESDFAWGYKPADITINPTSLSFAAPASSKDINVTLNHVPSGDYNVVSITDWLTLNKQSDKTVVTAAKNLNSSNRSTSIEFLCEGRASTDSQTATVTQSGVSLNLSSTSWSPTYTAQTKTGIKVTSSYEWSIASKPDWVTATKTSGNSGETLNVSVIKNTSNSDRDGNVQFKCGNVTKNLYIKQSGSPKITIDSTTLSITPASQNKTITVTLTNLSKYTVSSNQSWVTVPTGDQTSNSVVLNISANSSGARSATVTFTGYDLNGNVCTTSNNSAAVKTLTINQSTGVSSITVTPETWNLSKVDAASTTGKVTITNSSSWSVKSKPSWITVTPSSGTATSNITISTAENTGSNRSGSIVFECVGTYDSNTPSDNIAVTQKGKSAIDITPNAGLSFDPSASSSTASVSRTNIDTYSVEDDDGGNPNWCTATASGDTVAVTVTKNTGASRTCNVTVKGTGTSDGSQRSDSIPISQSAGNSSFSMSPVSFTTGPDATNVGTSTYSSTRTSTPQIEKVTSQTWCTATAVANGWSFSVEKNTSAARTAKFKVTCKGTYDDKEYAQEITVSQSSGVSGIVVTPATWNPTYKEQSISTNVTLTNATGYTPSVSYTNGSGWCTVNGNIINVSNYQSTSTSDRAATVTYTATGTHDSQSRTDTVVVTQTPGAYLTSGKTSWDAPALNASTTFKVYVYNADGFTVRSGYADWVTVTNNGDSVTIVCSENVANAARSTTVYFDTKNGKDGSSYYQSCVITQRAATISSRPYSVDITTSNFTMKYNSNATKQLAWTTKDIKTINGKDSGDPYVVSSTPTFSSNKTGNATVDSSGVVKFKAGSNDGNETSINVTITATYGNSDTVTATVQDVVTKGAAASRRLVVSPSSAQTIYVGNTVTLSATGYATYWKNINGSQSGYKYNEDNEGAQTCTWSTSDSNTASISSASATSIIVTGKKGKGDGTETTVAATITAKNTTYNSNGVTVTFNVKDKVSTRKHSVEISTSDFTLAVPNTQTISYKTYDIKTVNGADFGSKYEVSSTPTWSSSKTSNATVSGGVVTAKLGKNDGTENTVAVTITAIYGNSDTVTANIKDVVTKGAVASRRLVVSPSSAQTIYVGDTVTLSATGYTTYWKNINGSQSSYKYDEENEGAQTCTWSTSSSNTASISSSSASSITVTGKNGKGDGTETTVAATITAKNSTYNSTGVTVTFNVKDKITSKFISITSPSSATTIYVGGTQTYTAKKYHRINNGTTNYDMGNSSISWSSSSTSVATMNGAIATGKAGKGDGTETTVSTTITASCSGYTSATQTLYVRDKVGTEYQVVLNKSTLTVYIGYTGTITATVQSRTTINGTGTGSWSNTSGSVVWKSNNTSIANVNSGTVTGVSKGNTSVTATHQASGKYATCTIQSTEAPTPTITADPTTINSGADGSITNTTLQSNIAIASWAIESKPDWVNIRQFSTTGGMSKTCQIEILAAAASDPQMSGIVVISATSAYNKTGTVNIYVSRDSGKHLQSIVLSTEDSFTSGMSDQPTVIAYFNDGTSAVVTSNATISIATQSTSGVLGYNSSTNILYAGNAGTATVQASYTYKGVTKTHSKIVTVYAIAPELIICTPSSLSVTVGETKAFTISLKLNNGQTLTTGFTPSVSLINNGGNYMSISRSGTTVNVTGIAARRSGDYISVSATYQGVTITTQVNVAVIAPAKTLTSLSASTTKVTGYNGGSSPITITATYSDGTTENVGSKVTSSIVSTSTPGVASWNTSTSAISHGGTGTATIKLTYTYAGTSKDVIISVTTKANGISHISISAASSAISTGGSTGVTVTMYQLNGASSPITAGATYSTTSGSVTKSGSTATFKGPATATVAKITATYAGKTASCTVIVGTPKIYVGAQASMNSSRQITLNIRYKLGNSSTVYTQTCTNYTWEVTGGPNGGTGYNGTSGTGPLTLPSGSSYANWSFKFYLKNQSTYWNTNGYYQGTNGTTCGAGGTWNVSSSWTPPSSSSSGARIGEWE